MKIYVGKTTDGCVLAVSCDTGRRKDSFAKDIAAMLRNNLTVEVAPGPVAVPVHAASCSCTERRK